MDEKSLHSFVPSKELPKEVLELPPDQTRCQFCGVSYLVHHEVSKLKCSVKELEMKLKEAEELQKIVACKATKENDTIIQLREQVDLVNHRYYL